MAKIGRNEKCPCQSGKKYKHCCARKAEAARPRALTPEEQAKITLMGGVEAIQELAVKREAAVKEIGVFFFYSTEQGDAWLLEMTDCDCVQLASGGKRLEAPIDENPETIEINWSHTFKFVEKKLQLTAYEDRSEMILEDAPAQQANAMLRRIRKKFSPEQLRQVHADPSEHAEQPSAA